MSCLGDKFYGNSSAGPRFQDFLGLFVQVAQQYFGLHFNMGQLQDILQNMDLLTFIKERPEFLHAKRAEQFDYVSPILILEGLKFYEDFLLKKLGNEL